MRSRAVSFLCLYQSLFTEIKKMPFYSTGTNNELMNDPC